MKKVLSFGSLNLDLVYRVAKIVREGETIACKERATYPGGKGLNQSVALARAGAQVWHAGGVGEDGKLLLETLNFANVQTSEIERREGPSGHAIIQVDDEGKNCIIISPGANYGNTSSYIEKVLGAFQEGDLLVLQNEIDSNQTIMEEAKKKGLTIALNPSPLDEKVLALDLSLVDIFLLNEHEAAGILNETGEPSKLLALLGERFPNAMVVLTLGGDGSMCRTAEGTIYRQEAVRTTVVDTTAAGDTFSGYFLAALLEGVSVPSALKLAATAAAKAVSVAGAASSIPYRKDVSF